MKSFGSYHPAVLFIYFTSVFLVTMFVTNPILQLSALFGGILFCCTLIRRNEIPSDIGYFVSMFFLISITNPLFSHNGITPLFFLNGNPVTLEAIIYGISIAVMLIGVMMWCKCYSRIMTSDKFLYLFGKAIPKLSLILSMALRYIPMFKRQIKKVSSAQKSLGMYSSKGIVDRIQTSIRIFTAMLSWSFENAIDTSISMKSRGYGLKGRTNFSLYRFTLRDGIVSSVCISLLGITVIGAAIGETTFYYYPQISQIKISPSAIVIYISFAILSLIPFITEIREVLVWKYYVSKTCAFNIQHQNFEQ